MSKLYIVPTPIGNLKDMTYRAVEILQAADVIFCEDTRKTGLLLKHFGINKPMQSHHKFNEHKTSERIVSQLKAGMTAALVTDAGTPGISDPGFLLVRDCVDNGVDVETLPGAVALIPALVNSGLPCDRFTFEGFLPPKKGRQKKLTELSEEKRTMIFYESPHRLVKSLTQMSEFFGGERKASVSRELTKLFEETQRGTLLELIDYWKGKKIKGELVMVVEGMPKAVKKKNDDR